MSLLTEIEHLLRENAAKHDKTCRACLSENKEEPGVIRMQSYAEYARRRAQIYDSYTGPPHWVRIDDVENVERAVQDHLFAASRKTIEESVAILEKFVGDDDVGVVTTEDVSRAFSHVRNLTDTWHCQEHYYCADCFADRAGFRLALESCDHPRVEESDRLELQQHALQLVWNTGSTPHARLAQYQQGVVPVIADGLRRRNLKTVVSSLGVLWGLSELTELPAVLIESGVLTPLTDLLKTEAVGYGPAVVYLRWLAIGALHGFCANVLCYDKFLGYLKELLQASSCIAYDHVFDVVPAGLNVERLISMTKFFGYNAAGSLCLHATRKAWMQKMVGSRGEETSKSDVIVTEGELLSAFREISDWLITTDPESIVKNESGSYLWLCMQPFIALLYGIHPVLRRLGAFTLSCLVVSPESRRLIESEEGRGYDPIQCTTWCKDEEAKKYTLEAMRQITFAEKPSPPTLEKICCFYVSDNYEIYSDARVRSLPRRVLKHIAPFAHSD